jgi:hypothetical protein
MRTATATCAASTEPGPEHGEFLEHDLELGVVLQEREHVAHCVLAVAAIVIEEFDEGDVAIVIAERDLPRRHEQRLRILLDGGLALLGDGGVLLLLEFGHRVLENLRVRDEVFADDGLDLAALRRGEFGGACDERRRSRDEHGAGQNEGAGGHRCHPCFGKPSINFGRMSAWAAEDW